MTEANVPDAWVRMPSESEVRALIPPGTSNPYDFGVLPGMSRLLLSHDAIGPPFRLLYRQVMFDEGHLDRREREMVAAVAAVAQDCEY